MSVPRMPWPWQATTPPLRQAEHAECGLAALAILMAHHGRVVPLAALRARTGDPRLGSSLATLRRLARAEGFIATARRVEPETFHATPLPALIHLRFIHFGVLEAAGPWGYRINDPAAGPIWLTPAEFDTDFTGLAMWLEAPAAPRAQRFPLLSVARRWLAPAAPGLLRAGLLAAAGALAASLAATVAGAALAIAAMRGTGILPLLVVAAGCGAASLALGLPARRAASEALARAARSATTRTLRDAIASTRVALLRPGPVGARLAASHSLAAPALATAATALPAIATLALAAIATHPAIGAILALLAAGSLTLALAPAFWRGAVTARRDPVGLPLTPFPEFLLHEPGDWKTGSHEDDVFSRLAGQHALDTDDALAAEAIRARLAVAAEALSVIRLTLPLALFALGALSPETAATLAILAATMDPPLRRLAQGFGLAGLTAALHHLTDTPPCLPAPTPPAPALPPRPGLDIQGLAWPADAPVIDNLILHLPPGTSLAITGPSGAGKTMLLRLAAGLIPPAAGSLTLDGRPTESLPLGATLLVESLPFLPSAATLRETLALGLPITEENLRAALRRVGLEASFARRGGLDLVLTRGGAELSGGQRRRLALARALLRAPRLLLIDTALDALEPPLAAALIRQMREEGRTLLIATNRADIAAAADATHRLERMASSPDGGAAS